MSKIWINPMTGQQISLPEGQIPGGCWTVIGDREDSLEISRIKLDVPTDIDMSVGEDFTVEDDQF